MPRGGRSPSLFRNAPKVSRRVPVAQLISADFDLCTSVPLCFEIRARCKIPIFDEKKVFGGVPAVWPASDPLKST